MGPVEAVLLVLLILWIPAMIVTAMKERFWLLGIGVMIFPIAYIGALLEAKPGSWWIQRNERQFAERAAPRPPT
jgi:hypothetical protein